MSFTAASLSDGQVASSWGAIYTAAAKIIVKKVYFYNTGSSSETVDIGITRSGSTRRQFRKVVLAADQSAEYEHIVLSSGDTLDAQTTTATTVDYLVMGATE